MANSNFHPAPWTPVPLAHKCGVQWDGHTYLATTWTRIKGQVGERRLTQATEYSGFQRMETGRQQVGGRGRSGEDKQEGTDARLQERWSDSQSETEGE